MNRQELILYGITDRSWLEGGRLSDKVQEAINGGATIIQYREKNLDGDALLEDAKSVLEVCRKNNIKLIINDNVSLAKEIDADGVHLGQNDMDISKAREILGNDKIIGITAKTIKQAQLAEEKGANYLGSGAVFGSKTKKDAIPMEHDLLQKICESVNIPVVAIGGINKDNILELKGRKMAGVAVVSGIFKAHNIEEATKELFEKAKAII
ncbi:MAG: thiamine phosphate synthase [Agathobacter sp.]|nr:thiamine phosphate synthase [Agathobacter sp.]